MNIMTYSPSGRSIICQEVFDENSQPSEEEVVDYAKRIGINPDTEPYLLSIARDGLMQALPPGWKPVYDDNFKRYYYYNFHNGLTRWDHPLDDHYKELVRKRRAEGNSSAGEDDSKTSIKEDLKSYEEQVDISEKMTSSQSQGSQRFTGTNKQLGITGGGLPVSRGAGSLTGRPPLPPRRGRSRGTTPPSGSTSPRRHQSPSPGPGRPRGLRLSPSTRDTGQPFHSPSPTRIDIDSMAPLAFSVEQDRSPQEKLQRTPLTSPGLSLSGGGSVFLKSKQNSSPNSMSPQGSMKMSPDVLDPQKSIIKDKSLNSKSNKSNKSSDDDDNDEDDDDTGDDDDEAPVRDKEDSLHEVLSSKRFENVHDVESLQSIIVDSSPSKLLRKSISVEQTPSQELHPLKGILRDSSLCSSPTHSNNRILWDVDPESMTAEEKTQLRNQELEEERKRSVRFADFEKEPLDIQFEIPDSQSTTSTSSEEKGNWDSDIDEDDKLNAASSLDVSPVQIKTSSDKIVENEKFENSKLAKSNSVTGIDCSKIHSIDKIQKKTSWMEIENKKSKTDSSNKQETELMNRLVKLKRSENEQDDCDNDLLSEPKTILKKTGIDNVNIVDKIDNYNYTTNNYKTDYALEIDYDNLNNSPIKKHLRNITDINVNSLTLNKSLSLPSDNILNKAADSEIMSIDDANNLSPEKMTDNVKKIITSTTTNKKLKSSTRTRIVKSTIEYILKDAKSHSVDDDSIDVNKEIIDSNLKKNQNKKKGLLSIDNERLYNKKSSSDSRSLNDEYEKHYLIDEEMMYDKTNDYETLKTSDLSLENEKHYDIKHNKESNNSKLSNVNLLSKRLSDIDDTIDNDNDENYFEVNDKKIKINLQLGLDNKVVSDVENKSKKSDVLKDDSGNSVSPLDDTVSNDDLLSSSNSHKIKPNQKKYHYDASGGSAADLDNSSYDSFDIKDIALVQKVESLLEQFQGKLGKNIHEKILKLEKEQLEKLEAAKKEFEYKALEEREKLEEEMIEKLTNLKKLLKDEELNKEITMREEAEASLQIIRNRIKEENEEKIKQLDEEQKKFIEEQEEMYRIERDRIQDETNNRVQMSVHILAKFVEEMKQREEKEIERIKSENDEKLESIKKEYQAKEEEFAEKMKREMEVVESELEDQLNQLKERSRRKLEEEEKEMDILRKEYIDKREVEWRRQQEELVNTTDEHRARMEVLREECKLEEETLKKKHVEKVESLTAQINRTMEKDSIDITQLTRDFEKVRCEKRLLEDKYQILKEKYIRLKSDVRLSLERKRQAKLNRRNREQATTVVGIEDTDRSTSHSKTDPQVRNVSPRKKYNSTDDEGGENVTPKTIKRRPKQSPSTVNSSSTGESYQGENSNQPKNDNSSNLTPQPKNVCDPSPLRDRREGMDTEISSADEFSFATYPNEQVKGNSLKVNGEQIKNKHEENGPLENLKKQLEKLDELEEQFPLSAHTDTYLRYPFSGPAGSSCELEFYRHRLHLERESVRKAKQALTEQRHLLETKQIQLRHKQTSSTLHQLQQEEKELTDMEVHLHRTKALLGEKIIRLKHLELSLEQLSPTPAKVSPSNSLSEPSHSSGFSGSDIDSAAFGKLRPQRYWTDASFNVLQSLENINCEIREIWTILGKQQIPELGPPPPLQLYDHHQGDTSKVTTDQYYIRAQTADIADRTRGLRDWLTKTSKSHLPTSH